MIHFLLYTTISKNASKILTVANKDRLLAHIQQLPDVSLSMYNSHHGYDFLLDVNCIIYVIFSAHGYKIQFSAQTVGVSKNSVRSRSSIAAPYATMHEILPGYKILPPRTPSNQQHSAAQKPASRHSTS